MSVYFLSYLVKKCGDRLHLRGIDKKSAETSIYLSIGINVRFAAMMADVGDGLL